MHLCRVEGEAVSKLVIDPGTDVNKRKWMKMLLRAKMQDTDMTGPMGCEVPKLSQAYDLRLVFLTCVSLRSRRGRSGDISCNVGLLSAQAVLKCMPMRLL